VTRKFSSISIETTLGSPLSNTATSMTVSTGTGTALLGGVSLAAGNVDQFMVAIDPDTISEELVIITGTAGSDTFTIGRGIGGTSAVSHTTGAIVRHVLSGDDLTSFQATSDALPGKVAATSFTAPGQVLVGTGSGTFVAVDTGANGTVLTADDAEASGVKWATGGSTPTDDTGGMVNSLLLMGG
jgi:hypothetical protein